MGFRLQTVCCQEEKVGSGHPGVEEEEAAVIRERLYSWLLNLEGGCEELV